MRAAVPVPALLQLALCVCSTTEAAPVYSMGYVWRNTTEKANAQVAPIDLSVGSVPQSLDWRTKGNKEEALVAAVAQYGPVSICIDAEESFIKYKSGVYNGPCSSDVWKQNHCVSIVGYDVEEKYWLVRNTWGTGWGEDGYIRMAMGSNLCGITNEATIANVSKA